VIPATLEAEIWSFFFSFKKIIGDSSMHKTDHRVAALIDVREADLKLYSFDLL
jgi:hypothetical protein